MQLFFHGGSTFFPHSRAHDTVGAVAVDRAGNVASATSTGGIRNKMVGRVGDSPVIGMTSTTSSKSSMYTVSISIIESEYYLILKHCM